MALPKPLRDQTFHGTALVFQLPEFPSFRAVSRTSSSFGPFRSLSATLTDTKTTTHPDQILKKESRRAKLARQRSWLRYRRMVLVARALAPSEASPRPLQTPKRRPTLTRSLKKKAAERSSRDSEAGFATRLFVSSEAGFPGFRTPFRLHWFFTFKMDTLWPFWSLGPPRPIFLPSGPLSFPLLFYIQNGHFVAFPAPEATTALFLPSWGRPRSPSQPSEAPRGFQKPPEAPRSPQRPPGAPRSPQKPPQGGVGGATCSSLLFAALRRAVCKKNLLFACSSPALRLLFACSPVRARARNCAVLMIGSIGLRKELPFSLLLSVCSPCSSVSGGGGGGRSWVVGRRGGFGKAAIDASF